MKIPDAFAINVLARRAAIQAVKDQLYRQGARVSLVRIAEIHRLARAYLDANEAELIAAAKAKWEAINARTGTSVVAAAPVRSAARA
jgi:hypothetical protein